ncbi:MAG: hypothetical protein IJX90_12270 [Blautia sp.]|nr:hypothetical protein [Blautia sp.]
MARRPSPAMYRQQKEIAEEFSLTSKTVQSRLKELRELRDRYGELAVIDQTNLVLVYRPAFADYMRNREKLRDKNMSRQVPPYDPKKIIRELAMKEWDCPAVEEPKIDREEIKQLIREILLEGLRTA